jgi:hypothetical protein
MSGPEDSPADDDPHFDCRQEIERLARERDEWCAQAQRFRKRYAEIRYPGMTGVIKLVDADLSVEHPPGEPK